MFGERTRLLKGVRRQQKWLAFLCLTPLIVLLAVFMIYPVVFTFYLSFCKWGGVNAKIWVGLDNFAHIFGEDVFMQALVHSFTFVTLGTSACFILSFFIAYILFVEIPE